VVHNNSVYISGGYDKLQVPQNNLWYVNFTMLYVQSLVLCNLKQIKLLAYIDTLDAVMEALREMA